MRRNNRPTIFARHIHEAQNWGLVSAHHTVTRGRKKPFSHYHNSQWYLHKINDRGHKANHAACTFCALDMSSSAKTSWYTKSKADNIFLKCQFRPRISHILRVCCHLSSSYPFWCGMGPLGQATTIQGNSWHCTVENLHLCLRFGIRQKNSECRSRVVSFIVLLFFVR